MKRVLLKENKIIGKLKMNKALGGTMVTNRMLKELPEEFIKERIKKLLEQRRYPKEWKKQNC